jgi:hypothetical protein
MLGTAVECHRHLRQKQACQQAKGEGPQLVPHQLPPLGSRRAAPLCRSAPAPAQGRQAGGGLRQLANKERPRHMHACMPQGRAPPSVHRFLSPALATRQPGSTPAQLHRRPATSAPPQRSSPSSTAPHSRS